MEDGRIMWWRDSRGAAADEAMFCFFLACILLAHGVEPEATPVVHNLADCFRWVEHQCAIYKRLRPSALDAAAAAMQSRSMSTAFAGIGGAENAQGALYHGLQYLTGATMSAPSNLWACE